MWALSLLALSATLLHVEPAPGEVLIVGGVRIASRALAAALDLQGHDVDLRTFPCPACRTAIEAEGFCEEHRVGFVGGRAYFTRVTHALARGVTRDPSTLSCTTCRHNASAQGWCSRCKVGRVGATAFSDRARYEQALEAVRVLGVASDAAARCESCALAILTDTGCAACRVRYRKGAVVTTAP